MGSINSHHFNIITLFSKPFKYISGSCFQKTRWKMVPIFNFVSVVNKLFEWMLNTRSIDAKRCYENQLITNRECVTSASPISICVINIKERDMCACNKETRLYFIVYYELIKRSLILNVSGVRIFK